MIRDYRPATIRWVRVFDEHVWAIEVVWSDGENDIVNLSPLLEGKRKSLLKRFERSPDKFWDITIVDGGLALSWFNASVDISAKVIADLVWEQCKKQDVAALYDSSIVPVTQIPVEHGPSLLLESGGGYLLLQDGASTLLLEH